MTGENEITTEESVESDDSAKKSGRNRRGLKALGLLIAALVIAGGLWFAGNEGRLSELTALLGVKNEEVAATVNGEKITVKEIELRYSSLLPSLQSSGLDTSDQAAVRQTKVNILNSIIGEELFLQKAVAEGTTASDEEIEEFYSNSVNQAGNEEELLKQLSENDVSENKFKENIRRQLVAQKYIGQLSSGADIEAGEQEISDFYDLLSEGQDDVPPLESLYDQIAAHLRDQNLNNLLENFVQSLRAEANVEVFYN